MSECQCGDRMTLRREGDRWECECGVYYRLITTGDVDRFQQAFRVIQREMEEK